jgi:predicted Zn-dependent protease
MSLYVNVALPNILLHESGHFFGLQHTKEPCSIMRPMIDDIVGGICDYDRDTLRELYPAS